MHHLMGISLSHICLMVLVFDGIECALMITCNCVDSHLVTMLVRKGISLSELIRLVAGRSPKHRRLASH